MVEVAGQYQAHAVMCGTGLLHYVRGGGPGGEVSIGASVPLCQSMLVARSVVSSCKRSWVSNAERQGVVELSTDSKLEFSCVQQAFRVVCVSSVGPSASEKLSKPKDCLDLTSFF